MRIACEIDDRVAQFYLLAALGCHAAEVGQARLAARLIAAADAERTGAGANVMPFLAPALARATESAAATLGPAGFAAESETGRSLGRDAAVRLALGRPAAGQAASPRTATPIGPREADVARLVADGVDVIVATPGRLLDHLQERTITLAGVEIFVCGQNLARENIDPKIISPDVVVASAAPIVLMTYQNDGYALMSF